MANHNGRENNDPAFQFYTMDFWASPKVQCMTPGEGWVYLRLLSECYRQNGLPLEMEELEIIAMSAKMDPEQFRKSWDRIIGRCFVEHEGRWWSPRAIREQECRDEFRAEKSKAGKEGAKKRWAKAKAGKKATPKETPKKADSDSKAMANDSRPMGVPFSAMANDSPHPTPPHPNSTLTSATRARGNPEPSPVQNRAPSAVESERETWTSAIDGLLERELVSLEGRRVLVDLLDLRCDSEQEVRRLRLPRTEAGWLELARQVDQDHERATEALRRMKASSGVDFDRHLRWVDEDRTKEAKTAERDAAFQPKGSLAPIAAANAWNRQREAIIKQQNDALRAKVKELGA